MSKEVTITFNGISSPILKAITAFKLQKRNMKGLTESEKQKIVDELDELFIVMISDTKLNKGKPLWDFINLREAYICENTEDANENMIYDFRYKLYTKMLENNVPLETALYCLYSVSDDYTYALNFNIEYIDRVIDDLVEHGYLHKTTKKLNNNVKKILIWLIACMIPTKKCKLDETNITVIILCFIFLSLKKYGTTKFIDYMDLFGEIKKVSILESGVLDKIVYDILDDNMYIYDCVRINKFAHMFINDSPIISSTDIMNMIKCIIKSKNKINLYHSNFSVLLYLIGLDKYKIMYTEKIIEFNFEKESDHNLVVTLIKDLVENIDVKKALKSKVYRELIYFEFIKETIDDNNIKKKVMELKLNNK